MGFKEKQQLEKYGRDFEDYKKAILENSDNRGMVYEVCKEHYVLMQYASDRLKDDEDVVWASVSQNTCYLEEASKRILDDRDFMRKLCNKEPYAYKYLSERIRDDEAYVRQFVARNQEDVSYASKRLINDKEFVSWAIDQNLGLFYFGEEIRKDRDIVLKAVARDGEDLEYVSEDFRNDAQIVYTALHGSCPYIEYWQADDWWGEYPHSVFEYIGEKLRADNNFTMNVVESFLNIEPGKTYSREDFEKHPQRIYGIIYQMGQELSSPIYSFDFSKAIADVS